MFKKRSHILDTRLGEIIPPQPPPKKVFCTMMELLSDAEKYDGEGENEISQNILRELQRCIDKHCQSNT